MEKLRNEEVVAALDEAVATSKAARLYKLLALASGLPGPRANMVLANAFASDLAARKKKGANNLAFTMAVLSPDEAPGATELEFLPTCGVLAVGACAALDESVRKKAIALLHDSAEDPRYRVREVVPQALARIGAKAGDDLVAGLASWMDGYFQAAAVILALEIPEMLAATKDGEAVLARLQEALDLAHNAPRAAARYPGHKALMEALGKAPAGIALKYGVATLDLLCRWAQNQRPEVRAIVEQNLKDKRLVRLDKELARVRRALAEHAPIDRDAARRVHGTRGRGRRGR